MQDTFCLHPLALACTIACVLTTPLAQADTQADEPAGPDKSLGLVVVTGKQPTSLPSTLPTTLEGIQREQIERSINATDSEDALKYLPSLLVRKRYIGDYNHAVLSTRASGTGNSARSLVYADGVLLSNLLGNGASYTPRWGLVTPEEIERVDVLYGPFSAAYSGNSVGAVVDYVTRLPTRFEAHAQVGAFMQPFELYGTRTTYTGWQASTSLGNRVGEGAGALSWWFNLNRLDSKGQPLVFVTSANAPTGTTGAQPDTDPLGQPRWVLGAATQYHTVQDHAKLKLAYDIDTALRAQYTLGWWRNTAQSQSDTYLRDSSGNPTYTGGTFGQTRERFEHTMHALSLKQRTRGFFDWELAASVFDYGTDQSRAPTGAKPAADNGGAGRITDGGGTGWHTLAAKGVLRPNAAHTLDFGVQQEGYQLRSMVNNAADWISGSAGTVFSRFDGNTRLRSAYAQDSWRFAPDWHSVLGLRAEHWNAWNGFTQTTLSTPPGSANCTGTLCDVQHPARAQTFFSPKAALGWQAADDWTLRASIGRAIRFPTVAELYQGGVNSAGEPINTNPNLRPERSWTGELSSEVTWDKLRWRNTLFVENTHDALYSQRNPTTGANTVQNVDHVRTRGLENALTATDLFTRGLELQGSLTYADSKVLANSGYFATPGDTTGKDQVRVPRWRASALVTWRATDQLTTSLGARYGSRQFNQSNNLDTNGFTYTGTSKYAVADLRLHYRFDKQWSAALGIDNLFNYTYWNFHPYPQRTYSAQLKYDL